ncbi:Uu.00g087880.m01.CDS01 [Anthostomella pinea]|uniref:Uu.00g087880.m01.CDS01 n=1 Tax=Anthostomella pinea TaxID=933095 RepID=A0AAI8VN28_9PEZI|nr:Uu.00g087880.m01.CDS01 [Anthostomella pinea]
MTRKPAKSVQTAERRALEGSYESQDSQLVFQQALLEHAVGMCSSSPAPDNPPIPAKEFAKPNTSHPANDSEAHLLSIQYPKDASTKNAPPGASRPSNSTNSSAQQAKSQPRRPHSSAPRSLCSSLTWEPKEIVVPVAVVPSIQQDAVPAIEPPSPLIKSDVLPQLPSSSEPLQEKKKKARDMSSQSPTQSNEGRSYEQYDQDGSQPQSTQGSSAHRTLHEGDTGFVNLVSDDIDLPDSAPDDSNVNLFPEPEPKSQYTSQPSTNGIRNSAPETPAVRHMFPPGCDGHVMPASQMFRQTQSTAVKPSPTSSRPSPDLFNHNTISPNPLVSSPLKDRGLRTSPIQAYVSSPPAFVEASSRPSVKLPSQTPIRNHTDTAETPRDQSETPLPQSDVRKASRAPEPNAEYHPFRRRGSGSDVTKSPSQGSEDSDFGDDQAQRRSRLAKSRREKASESLSLPPARPSSNKATIEVPSTNGTKPKEPRIRTPSDEYRAQCTWIYDIGKDSSQETVADSQDAPVPQETAKANKDVAQPSNDAKAKSDTEGDNVASSAPIDRTEYRETIPETSPPGTSAEPPRLVGDIMKQYSSGTSSAVTMSLPVISSGADVEEQEEQPDLPRRSSLPEPESSGRISSGRNKASRPEPINANSSPSVINANSSPSVIMASSQRSIPRQSTRLKIMTTPSSTAPELHLPSEPGTGTSTLTTLSMTPNMTSSTTPNTENDMDDEHGDKDGHTSSPALAKVKRRGRPPSSLSKPSPSLPKVIKTYSRSSVRKGIRQSSRHSSVSIDELARSPSASGPKDRKVLPRKRQSTANQLMIRESSAKDGIFEGMVFAISFQERGRTQKSKEKHADRTAVERMIRSNGGTILADGFNELFKFDSLQTSPNAPSTPVLSSSLKLIEQGTGFTALIADGHSRKVKYMQALALGIPCLAPKWVTTCVSKQEVVDWSSYLLCAGSSSLLGDAIRSRSLQPHDASTAKLAEVISHRSKLLDESKILLVMKRTKNEEKRLPYVFLAQVLGASLVRVHTLEDARAKLQEKEAQDEEFDWVYVDDHLQDARDALFGTAAGGGSSKKRKRQSTGVGDGDRPPKRIRTLNDELVIQSLILGRLIEDGEMEE